MPAWGCHHPELRWLELLLPLAGHGKEEGKENKRKQKKRERKGKERVRGGDGEGLGAAVGLQDREGEMKRGEER